MGLSKRRIVVVVPEVCPPRCRFLLNGLRLNRWVTKMIYTQGVATVVALLGISILWRTTFIIVILWWLWRIMAGKLGSSGRRSGCGSLLRKLLCWCGRQSRLGPCGIELYWQACGSFILNRKCTGSLQEFRRARNVTTFLMLLLAEFSSGRVLAYADANILSKDSLRRRAEASVLHLKYDHPAAQLRNVNLQCGILRMHTWMWGTESIDAPDLLTGWNEEFKILDF